MRRTANLSFERARRWRLAHPRQSLDLLHSSGRRVVRPRREPARIVTAPIFWIAGVALVAVLCLLPFDERISRMAASEPDGVRTFLAYATDAGLIAWYLYPALLLVLALLIVRTLGAGRRALRRRHALAMHGAYLAGSVAIAQILVQILKAVFGRARPALLDDYGPHAFQLLRLGNEYASFPSGHSATMGVVTVAALVWFPTIRWPILIAGACLAISRVVVQAHFPSDVVAGWSIGIVTAIVLARWLAVRRIAYRIDGTQSGWGALVPFRAGARLP